MNHLLSDHNSCCFILAETQLERSVVEGVPLTLVGDERAELLRRIDPEVKPNVGAVIVQTTGPDGGGVILYNSSTVGPSPESSADGKSNFSGITHYGLGGGAGINDPPSTSDHQPLEDIVLTSQPEYSTGNGLRQLAAPDMSALLTQVKNEPEDLTGNRRDSTDPAAGIVTSEELNNIAARAAGKGNQVVVSTPGGPVVLSSTDLGNPVYSPVVVTSPIGPPVSEHSSYPAEFSPFSDASRNMYPPDHYRHETDLYNPAAASSPDFGPRADVQYVQYHYKGGPDGSIPPLGGGGAGAQVSPDSGIGDPPAGGGVVAPPPPPGSEPTGFDGSSSYTHPELLSEMNRKPWNDYRQNEEKIHIPKTFNQYGFKYTFEAATSSSQRREDDKITYINKGQFYGITLGKS